MRTQFPPPRPVCVRSAGMTATRAAESIGERAAGLDIARLAERAREEGRLDRHGVHARGPLPAAALPRPGRCRRPRSWCSTARRPTRPGAAGRVLADPGVEVVLHAGRQDVAILRRAWNATFANVFDTQIAAGFAGFSAQAGYTGLLHDVLRIRLAEVRELHPLGRPAADARAAALRARGRRAPAARWPTSCSAGWSRAGGSSGRARSAARSLRRPTSATPRRPGGGCRACPGSTRALGPSRASSPPGASARPRARTGRSARSCATRRVVELAKREPPSRRELAQIRGIGPDVVRRRARRHPRRDRARPRGAADPARRGRALATEPRTRRRSRSPRRSCARARRRPGSPTS